MQSYYQQIESAASYINDQLKVEKIDYAVLLGSGLNDLGANNDLLGSIKYSSIPGMLKPTVTSHEGSLDICKVGSKSVAFCRGRLHLYEGHSAQQVAYLVYVLRELGVSRLIVTNAAGALNPAYKPGDIMIIQDHINTTGHNPVVGQDDTLGQRFADMSQAYPALLSAQALRIGCNLNLPVHLGVYAGVLGPTLETSAERKMLRNFGADAVGMSTVTEVIAANHCGMQVIGFSAITNMATGNHEQQPDNLDDMLSHAATAGSGINTIIQEILI